MNLREDLRNIVIQHLDKLAVKFERTAAVEDLLVVAATVDERRVKPTPRKIHKSAAYTSASTLLPPTEEKALLALETKLAEGTDVNGHLSRFSLKPTMDDDLLVDWGVHHFHLSLEELPGDTFLARTDNLAFAHVGKEDVYFATILTHGNFQARSIIETLLGSFPDFAARHEMKGIEGLAVPEPTTPDGIRLLRKAHVNSSITFNEKIYYSPGSGFMAAGNSLNSIRRTQRTLDEVDRIAELFVSSGNEIRQKIIDRHPHLMPESLEFTLVSDGTRWLVHEKKSDQVYHV